MPVPRFPLDPPRVIAHRGASSTHPENTVAAFDQALAEGCDGLELDLQLSRDGVPVVYHDRTLRQIGGGGQRVGERDWAELASLDAGGWFDHRFAGQRMPTLGLVLDRYGPRTRLLLEIKARPDDTRAGRHLTLADALVEQIRTRRLQTAMVLCFDLETLDAVTARAPEIPTVLNLKAPRHMSPALRRSLDQVWALSIDVRTISDAIVAAVHDAGKPVLTYTCNTAETVSRAILAGADGLMSDRPGWLRRTIDAGPDAPAEP